MSGMAGTAPAQTARALQRHETRERVYEAALAEIARSGLAAADVGTIVAAAGVARGTFYFHFPVKEEVLVELERREELRMVAYLERRTTRSGDLRADLEAIVRQVRAAERRLGAGLFREMLAMHFRAPSPDAGALDDHPLGLFLVDAVRAAQSAGRVDVHVDAVAIAAIFLTGLFGLLATRGGPGRARDALLDAYVATILDGAVRS